MSEQGAQQLWRTAPHACAYLPEQTARLAFIPPSTPLDGQRYGLLLEQGFRRSGPFVYRPACPGCSACRSLRIPAAQFQPRRRHRRCLRDNAELYVEPRSPQMTQEHFALYRDYLHRRHPGSSMGNPGWRESQGFLAADWCPTVFYELRTAPGGRLLAVTVADILPRALSAVYTFFDPDEQARGLGTLAILWLLREARRTGRPHVYLGYWIAEAQGMAYKAQYRPHERYCGPGAGWERVD